MLDCCEQVLELVWAVEGGVVGGAQISTGPPPSHWEGRKAAQAYLPHNQPWLQWHFPMIVWPTFCVKGLLSRCKRLAYNHQSRHCSYTPEHHGTTCAALPRIMSDISRLPAAPGHPEASQSVDLSLPNLPLAEPSSITVYHLNQTDIWRESGASTFICLASVVLSMVLISVMVAPYV